MKVKLFSRVRLFATLWTIAHQAPPSMGFSRQEYRSGLPFPSPEDLPDPGIKPRSPTLQADALTSESPGKPNIYILLSHKNNEILSFTAMWMGLQNIMLSAISQTEKDKYHMLSLICGI